MVTAMATLMDTVLQRTQLDAVIFHNCALEIREMMRIAMITAWAVVTFAIAISSFLAAWVGVFAATNPERALAVSARDGLAGPIRAAQLLQTVKLPEQRSLVALLACNALRDKPLNPEALRIMGVLASFDQKLSTARALNSLSQKTSRRNFGNQIWFIEEAASRNDIAATLQHYDIALRTTRSGRDVLFPILLNALFDVSIQENFGRYLSENPIWMSAFLDYATANGPKAKGLISAITVIGGLPRTSINTTFESRFLAISAETNAPQEFKAFFRTMANADLAILTSAEIDDRNTNQKFIPVAWATESSSKAEVLILKDDSSRQSIRTTVFGGQSSTIASKLIFLPPGRYSFGTKQSLSTARAALDFTIDCAMGSRAKNLLRVNVQGQGRSVRTDQFSVGQNCPAQRISIIATGDDRGNDAELHVERLQVMTDG
jgi:hypothetical protein